MGLPFLSSNDLLARQITAAQAASGSLTDLGEGSALRATLSANRGVALWLQYLIGRVLAVTRAATSMGADLDSFVADFSMSPRLPAVAAAGTVTFSRYVAAQQALVPPGATVRSSDLSQTAVVQTDTTNAAWSVALGGYVLPIGTASVTVPAAVTSSGSAGNVAAGTLSVPGTAIAGVDLVTNAAAFVGGVDAETDAALRLRFQGYIAGLRGGVNAAILSAAQGVQQGLKLQLLGAYPQPGFYTLYASDASGNLSSALQSALFAAVAAVSSEGVQPAVVAPSTIGASVSAQLRYVPGSIRTVVEANVTSAISAVIASLNIGDTLSVLRLAQVIQDADPGVAGILSLSINGALADLSSGNGRLVVAQSIAVS